MRWLAALALVCAAAGPARADGGDDDPMRGGIGAGGYLGLTAAGWGPSVTAELYPGGRFGRYGFRADVRGYRDTGDGQALLGATYVAAASRPRLQLALHGGVGLSFEEVRPVIGGGVQTTLWVIGPVALATGATASVRIDGVDTSLALTLDSQLWIAW